MGHAWSSPQGFGPISDATQAEMLLTQDSFQTHIGMQACTLQGMHLELEKDLEFFFFTLFSFFFFVATTQSLP
jgi:hypothetical protein